MLFNFSVYSSLLLVGFVHGLIYGSLLLVRSIRKQRLSDRLLGILVLLLTLHIAQYMLGFAGWYDVRDAHTTFMFYFPFHQLLFIGPLIYFYFRSLTNTDFQFQRRHGWHFLPGGLLLGVYLIAFFNDLVVDHWLRGNDLPVFSGTKGGVMDFLETELEWPVILLWNISMITYTVVTARSYFRYRRYLNNNFADQEGIRFQWLRNLLYALGLGLACTWAMDIYGLLSECNCITYKSYWYSHLAIAAVIIWVGIAGHNNTQVVPALEFEAEDDPPDNFPAPLPSAEPATNTWTPELAQLKDRLEQLMARERPYLEPGLTLKVLSSKLQTNPSVLSKVINSGFQKNFNDYINERRVGAAKEALTDPQFAHLTLIAIAEECGFNSKSTFNRAFRKFSGMSPREYLAQKPKDG